LTSISKQNRRAAASAYKRQKVVGGVYAVRCNLPGLLWVGKSPNLATVWNRLTFELRGGHCRCQSLQEAWNSKGAAAFAFEEVERIDAEELSFALDRVMEERLDHWCSALSGKRLR
jgi:hypothetical protein